MKRACVIGAGGHARSVINLLELNRIGIDGIYDDSFDRSLKETIDGYELKGGIADVPNDKKLVLAIGDNNKRMVLFNRFHESIWKPVIVHPKAIIEKRSKFGSSNLVFAGAYVNSDVSIGDDNIINTGSVLEHEASVGNHNHLSIGAIICGRAVIGSRCFLGAGAVVIDKMHICDDVIVGAQAVVVDDIKIPGTYAGNPAKKIR